MSRAPTGEELTRDGAPHDAALERGEPQEPELEPNERGAGDRPIRVLVVDDHVDLRAGIALLLDCEPELEVVGEASDGHEALEVARRLRPDVVLMDSSMPGGLSGCEATRALVRELPGIAVVGLSGYDRRGIGDAMLRAGASAFVTKGGDPDELVQAIRAAAGRIGEEALDGEQAPVLPVPAAEPPAATPAAPLRVVVADEHGSVRDALVHLLGEEPGLSVIGAAADREELLSLARDLRPAAVVLDAGLPPGDGAETIRRLKAELPDVRVVGISMDDSRELAGRLLAAGAAAFVAKGGAEGPLALLQHLTGSDASIAPALGVPRSGSTSGEPLEEEDPTLGGRGPLRVLIADDHALVREGLVLVLEDEPDLVVVGEAENGAEAVERALALRPDVVVLDTRMPVQDGLEATRRITAALPGVRVIGLSMHEEREVGAAMLLAGADAYLTKGSPAGDLVAAIRGGRRRPCAQDVNGAPAEATAAAIEEAAPEERASDRPTSSRARRRSQASTPQVRVLVADDHAVLRDGLISLFREESDIVVVGEAADGLQAVELGGTLKPDVVLMDISMPHLSGIEATRRLCGEHPAVRVIGLSMHERADMARAMSEAGAAAYLTKGGSPEVLLETIRRIAQRPAAAF